MPCTLRFRPLLESLETRYALSADLTGTLAPVEEPILIEEASGEIGSLNEGIPEIILDDLGNLEGAEQGWLYSNLTDPIFDVGTAASGVLGLPEDSILGEDVALFDALESLASNPLPAVEINSIPVGIEDGNVEADFALGLPLADGGYTAFADGTPTIPEETRPHPLEWRAESVSVRRVPHFITPAFAHHGSHIPLDGDIELEESEVDDFQPADDSPDPE